MAVGRCGREEHSGKGPEVRTGLCWSGWHSGWEDSNGDEARARRGPGASWAVVRDVIFI